MSTVTTKTNSQGKCLSHSVATAICHRLGYRCGLQNMGLFCCGGLVCSGDYLFVLLRSTPILLHGFLLSAGRRRDWKLLHNLGPFFFCAHLSSCQVAASAVVWLVKTSAWCGTLLAKCCCSLTPCQTLLSRLIAPMASACCCQVSRCTATSWCCFWLPSQPRCLRCPRRYAWAYFSLRCRPHLT